MYSTSEFNSQINPQIPVDIAFFSQEQTLPVVVIAKGENSDICQWVKQNHSVVMDMKHKYGAVLFRYFNVSSVEKFKAAMSSLGLNVLNDYGERQIKRASLEEGVFTSTSHPKEGTIFLHNEQSFNLMFPQNILFNCHTPSETGGCTPLADSRKVFQKIPQELRDKFVHLGYRYVRNFMENIYVDWQWAFQTETKEGVEKYCQENDIHFEWKDDGAISLKTWQIRPVAAYHPVTKEPCWFNHCLAFNVKNLEPMAQQFITSSFSIEDYPYHTFFGNGEEIDEASITALREAYLSEQVTFQWKAGDFLFVDNLAVSHGRQSYEGERLVLAAMADPCNWSDVQYS